PASWLNQFPCNAASSSGFGVHCRSATKRVTAPSSPTLSTATGLPSLSKVNFILLLPSTNCPPPIGIRRPPLHRGTPLSIANRPGKCVFSFRQRLVNFFSSSSETFAGSTRGAAGNGPKISSVMLAATAPALGEVPLHMTATETLLFG